MPKIFILRATPHRPLQKDRLPRRGHRAIAMASRLAAGVACFLFLGQGGLSAAVTGDDKPTPSPHQAQDGFTRESMAELGRPEPTPAPARVGASTRKMRVHADPKDFNPQRHVARRQPPVRERPQIVIQGRHHRNPVVRFVYWWNGWVIRTFHTRIGTVMLHTVGAKT